MFHVGVKSAEADDEWSLTTVTKEKAENILISEFNIIIMCSDHVL